MRKFGDEALKVIPAYWTETQEAKFTNVLKEHTLRLQAAMRGECPEAALTSLKYDTVAETLAERLSPYQGEAEYTFAPTKAPFGSDMCGNEPGYRKTWEIKTCTGYEHCTQDCVVDGFFFKEARSVPNHAIFRDWDEIVNEIAAHLETCGTPHRSKI